MKAKIIHALLGLVLISIASGAMAADKVKAKKGGLIGNTYASQMDQIDDSTLRITTRKKVSGDLEEVNKPGTTTYNALKAISDGGSVRAALEAKNLGFKVFQVLGVRNLSQSLEKRSASQDVGGISESSFTFAPGHYTNDIELVIEMTVKLVPGDMPASPPAGYVSVEDLLKAWGLSE